MWITKVQLSNIKSYGKNSPPIFFRRGVNLIQGRNGAGKSTILEAIGLALFDSRAYTHEQFVREGAQRGEVVVGFVSAWDEREYEVVRGINGGSTYIYDPETRHKICTGKDDTFDFIRQHLNVDPETDLAALFRDAVGVPQGTMTAIFRETPRSRKEKFNSLLRIDEYERAWNVLRDTGNYIRDRIGENDRDIAGLKGRLEALPGVSEEIEHLTDLTAQERESLDNITARLEELQAELDALDSLKQQIDNLDREIKDFKSEVRLLEERLGDAEAARQEAQEAADIAAETEEAHRLYQEAQQTLRKLEEESQERQRLQNERQQLDTALQLCRQQLAQVQQELKAVEEAEAALAELKPLVEKQQALEDDLAHARQDQEEHNRLHERLEQYRGAWEELHNRLDAVAGRLEADNIIVAPEVAGEAVADTLEACANAMRDRVGELESAAQRFGDARDSLLQAQESLADLQAQIQERAALQKQLDTLDAQWQEVQQQEQAARSQVEQITHDLEKLAGYRDMLAEADAVCPVCRRPMDEHARAESERHYADERRRLEAALEVAEAAFRDARSRREALEADRAELNEKLGALPTEAALSSAQQQVDRLQEEFEQRRKEAARLLAAALAGEQAFDDLLTQTQERVAALSGAEQRIGAIEAELADLHDPRRQYEQAEEKAAQREEVETRLGSQQEELETLQTKLDVAEEQLAPYADLDDRLAAMREQRDVNEEAHQRYLAKKPIADQLASRQQAVDSLQEELAARREELTRLQEQWAELASGYDAEAHEKRRSEKSRLVEQQTENRTRLEEHEEQLEKYRQKADELEQVQQELLQREQEAERLETRQEAFSFVRDGIRAAGPQIARQLVRMIAERANHIFGDILDDHSLVLNWSEDYAVTVNVRGEERDFELLSGGEQMAAAMAIRLALLTQLADVRFAFFDEPTTNLDETRRRHLAESLSNIQSLHQIFVISHDDTFEQDSYHVIQVYKENGVSQVEII